MTAAYLGLGSNLGRREALLEQATAALAALGNVVRSNWYETEPVGMDDAGPFLNGCVRLETGLEARELLDRTTEIECRLGRDPARRAGPRTIDIDLLFYGDEVIHAPGLDVPHPRLHQRAFVLVPLKELAPQLRHPELGRTVAEMAAAVGTAGVRKRSGT
uniref:2-amino-4-hydroxy-6-hydroxymethyldihydropteridine diphosphokinase n=1 Tax=candidate division WOR-3 bacterium TaxID=2052148 RepID=A0A7C4CAT6_UNCW3